MTILVDVDEAVRVADSRSRPNLHFVEFSVPDLLRETRAELFSDIQTSVSASFVIRGPLACVTSAGSGADIYVHHVLNHAQTPREIIAMILIHELLHLRIPPKLDGRKSIQHPAEFWAAEKAISPTKGAAWSWIWMNLGTCLKRRPRLERIDVTPSWKRVWGQPKSDIRVCQERCHMTLPSVLDENW